MNSVILDARDTISALADKLEFISFAASYVFKDGASEQASNGLSLILDDIALSLSKLKAI
jgi:hypothetical protein